jgi:hypothetical protein
MRPGLSEHQAKEASMRTTNKTLMASAAAAALVLSFSTTAFADCAEEIAALKAQQFTGSIGPSEEPNAAPEELIDEGAATAEATEGEAGAAPAEELEEGTATAEATEGETGAAPAEELGEGTATAEATEGAAGAASEDELYQGQATAEATGEAGATSEELPDQGTATADAAPGDKKPVAGQVPGTQATADMNKVVGGRATSAQDVRAQDLGEATAAQSADAAEEAPEVDMQVAAADAGGEADQFAALLKRAEEYDKLGNEEACMNVVEEAQALVQ